MIEFLQYVFSSFWIFCGTCVLISLIGSFLVGIAGALGLKKEIHKYIKDEDNNKWVDWYRKEVMLYQSYLNEERRYMNTNVIYVENHLY